MIKALQGTRMGRKVESVEKVLEDAKGWEAKRKDLENQIREGDPAWTEPELPSWATEDHPDHFAFASLELKSGSNIPMLRGLEIPALRCWSLAINHTSATDYQREKIDQSAANPETNNGALPLRVQYWFLRAAYEEIANTGGSPVGNVIREFFRHNIWGAGIHYAEDMTWIRAGKRQNAFWIRTKAWPNNHPLSRERISPELVPTEDLIALTSGNPILPALTYCLFDDPDPIRVNKVLIASMGSGIRHIYLRIPSTLVGGDYSIAFDRNNTVLNLGANPTTPRKIQTLYAPAGNFTNPEVKP